MHKFEVNGGKPERYWKRLTADMLLEKVSIGSKVQVSEDHPILEVRGTIWKYSFMQLPG